MGDQSITRLYTSAFHQASLIIWRYPFILLGEERRCESEVPKNTTLWLGQVSSPDLLPGVQRINKFTTASSHTFSKTTFFLSLNFSNFRGISERGFLCLCALFPLLTGKPSRTRANVSSVKTGDVTSRIEPLWFGLVWKFFLFLFLALFAMPAFAVADHS